MRTWLIFDVSQIAWASFHTTGGLKYKNTPTGVSFGFLAALLRLQGELESKDVVFCFDVGRSKRYSLWDGYKAGRQQRRTSDPREQAVYIEVCKQIDGLRTNHLPRIGYQNIFFHKGYEADDMIASVCCNLPKKDKAIVISSDKDFYQLLSRRVRLFNPANKTFTTRKSFEKEFGIRPRRWVTVKSLAGCSSDDIPGIKGVGEKTAAKYLRGELSEHTKAYQSIQTGLQEGILLRNRELVKLPLPDTPACKPVPDKEDLTWGPTLKALNIKTLNPHLVYEE